MKFKDITGQKFGRLTALYKLHNGHKNSIYWLCNCDCGNLSEVNGAQLRNGQVRSCGCYRRERLNEVNTKHGKRHTRLYNIYMQMKKRCYNKNSPRYYDYGGRGIAVCDEWLNDFMNFYHWSMDHGYRDELTIDRIDNDKGYSPGNCQFIDKKAQNKNRRSSINITFNNETRCLKDWCERLGLKYITTRWRIQHGWPIEKAFKRGT